MGPAGYPQRFNHHSVIHHRLFIVLLLPLVLTVPQTTLAQKLDEETIERAKKATVMVWTLATRRIRSDTVLGTGTGYFINSTGLLLTNNHVVDPAHGMSPGDRKDFRYKTNQLTYKIILFCGTDKEDIFESDLVYRSIMADQALLQVRSKKGGLLPTPNYLRLLPSWRLHEDLAVAALGFPSGHRIVARGHNAQVLTSVGKITRVLQSTSGRVGRIETDAIARPGHSGGPMIEKNGNVVGTVTLRGQCEKTKNLCVLVPAGVTRSFLHEAITNGHLPDGADVEPFLDILATKQGQINVPAYKRMTERDTVFMSNGERIYGAFGSEHLDWESPLGHFRLPIESVAYVMRDGFRMYLVLENGDYIAAVRAKGNFPFAAEGGADVHISYKNVSAVAFRLRDSARKRMRGPVAVLSSDAGRLLLTDIEGQASLVSRSGQIGVSLADIVRIESRNARSRRIVTLADDRVIVGRLGSQMFRANIGGMNRTIELELSQVSQATIEIVDGRAFGTHGVILLDIQRSSDAGLIDVVRRLDADDLGGAREILVPYLASDRMKHMPDGLKSQVRLLDGIISLRAGEAVAAKKMRKCSKARNPHVAAYARASLDVLRRFGDRYDGRPLTDPETFLEAGLALGRESIQKARRLLDDRGHLEGTRGAYSKYLSRIKDSEKAMQSASVFSGMAADFVLMDLWKMTLDLCRLESQRLIRNYNSYAARRKLLNDRDKRVLFAIRKEYDEVMEVWSDRYAKLREYGFYITAEPDVHDFESRESRTPRSQ